MRDALRLSLGTLTILPVRAPVRVDRRTGGRAMVLAPLVGLLLGVLVVVPLRLAETASARLSPLLAAALVVAALAVLTRGMHLDGLADTADGLGSGKGPDAALAVMRKSDVGPFGVASLVLTLVVQVAALSASLDRGDGWIPLLVAVVVSRLALPLVCSRGIPAARADGLGSTVAGAVSRRGLLAATVLAIGGVVLVSAVGGLIGDGAVRSPGTGTATRWLLLGGVLPLVAAWLLCRRCVHRLGGVTGDVLGACVEVSCTVSLVLLVFA